MSDPKVNEDGWLEWQGVEYVPLAQYQRVCAIFPMAQAETQRVLDVLAKIEEMHERVIRPSTFEHPTPVPYCRRCMEPWPCDHLRAIHSLRV